MNDFKNKLLKLIGASLVIFIFAIFWGCFSWYVALFATLSWSFIFALIFYANGYLSKLDKIVKAVCNLLWNGKMKGEE